MIKRISSFGLLLLVMSAAFAQQFNRQFIGAFYNEDYRYTLPLILDFKDEDSIKMVFIGQPDKVQWLYLNGDSLIGESRSYAIKSMEPLVLSGPKDNLHFFSVKPKKKSGIMKLEEKSVVIKTEKAGDLEKSEIWKFTKDSVFILRQYNYQQKLMYEEFEKVHFQLEHYSQNLQLLVFYDDHLRPFRVFEAESKGSIYSFFDVKQTKKITGELIKSDLLLPQNELNIIEKQHLYQYYQFDKKPIPSLGYNQLKNNYIEAFKTEIIEGENGFITLRFVLSRDGEVGRFELEQMNHAYQSINYNPLFIRNLINSVTEIQWQVAHDQGEPYDCQMFLLFKIQNGKLVDVYV